MTCRVYKSSIYRKVLYGVLSAGILIPALWTMSYGLQKGGYNVPIFIMSALVCSCTIYIYQRLFNYKVLIQDDHMEIWDFNKKIFIRYGDIIDIKVSRSASYIIDRIMVDGKYYIRGTLKSAEGSVERDLFFDCRKLPVLQRAYVSNYHQMIQDVLSKCGIEGHTEVASTVQKKTAHKSYFVPVSLLKEIDEMQVDLFDSLNILLPYVLLLIVFLMTLVEYGVWRKGIMPLWLIPHIRLVFPLFTVVTIYIIVIKYTCHIKALMDKESVKLNAPPGYLTAYIIVNMVLSACIISLFFLMLNRCNI